MVILDFRLFACYVQQRNWGEDHNDSHVQEQVWNSSRHDHLADRVCQERDESDEEQQCGSGHSQGSWTQELRFWS